MCLNCNNNFMEFPSVIKNGGGKYCSMGCANEHRTVSLVCNHCKKEFKRYKSESINSKITYCSRDCQSQRRHEKPCFVCKKPFLVYESDLKRGLGKYCSLQCRDTQATPQEKFFKQISNETHINNCWEWIGNKDKDGYGRLSLNKIIRAHRYSWELYFGKIPGDLIICHRCDNPPCVNPDHLFIGTHLDNARDREKKGRGAYSSK